MKPHQIAFTGLALCLAASLAAAGPAAEPAPKPQAVPVDNAELVTVKLLETVDLVVPAEEVVVLLQATVAKGWHTYWNGPSDTGFALKPTWTLPEGWTVVKTEWPVPKRHTSPGDILDHIYEGQVTLVVTLKAPADAAPGSSAPIGVDVAWLACQEACIPGHAKADLELKIAPPGAKPIATNIDPLMTARASLALTLPPNSPIANAKLEQKGTGWVYRIRAGRAERIRFFPGPDCVPMPNLFKEGDAAGTESVLTLDAKEGETPRVQGIIQIVYPGDTKSGKPGRVSSFSIDTASPWNQPTEPSAPPAAVNPGR